MDQKHNSQLLFIYPQDPQRSFFYAYQENNSRLKDKIIGDLITKIEEEKECYLEFTDVFGREVPDDSTEDYFKALQPFYIKRMVPKLINLHITVSNQSLKIIYEIDPEETFVPVKMYVEKTFGIPVGQQIYFLGERELFSAIKLINQQISEKDVEIRLEVKARFFIRCPEKDFKVNHDLKDFGSQLISSIIQKNENLKDAEFSVFHNGNNLLDPDTTLEKSGLKSDDILTVQRNNIEVSISGSVNLHKRFAPSTQISDIKKYFMRQKEDLLAEGSFNFQYGWLKVFDNQPLSDLNKNQVELEIRPRPGNILVQLKSYRQYEKFSPALVVMNKNRKVGDIMRSSFRRQYSENLCEWTCHGENVTHDTVLKNISPGDDVIQLTYKISWDDIYKGFQMFVKILTGEFMVVRMNLEDPIEKLAEQIHERLDISPEQQRLLFSGKQLEGGRTAADYKLYKECTVYLLLRLRGGHVPGMPFADITKEKKAKIFEWSTGGAPDWRMTREGLCLEGKCLTLKGGKLPHEIL